MSKFYDILQEIKSKPKLYIKQPSLDFLEAFIMGYSFCENQHNIIRDDCFKGFNEYIYKKYRIYIQNYNFFSIIRFFAITDEQAFYQFYEDFEEFSKLSQEEKDTIVKEVELNSKKYIETIISFDN